MLRVHEAVAVVKRTCPNQVPNEGERPEKRSLLLWTHPQSEGCAELCNGSFSREGTSRY